MRVRPLCCSAQTRLPGSHARAVINAVIAVLLCQSVKHVSFHIRNTHCRSSRSHAIFTITVEQRRRQLVRPASAQPRAAGARRAVEGGRERGSDGSESLGESDSEESDDDEDDEAHGGEDEYLIAKVWRRY